MVRANQAVGRSADNCRGTCQTVQRDRRAEEQETLLSFLFKGTVDRGLKFLGHMEEL